MGRRGPPPKPTAIRRLEGNASKRPLNEREPRTTAGVPRRPAEITGRARREWDAVLPELAALGVLATCDRVALAGYALAAARFFDLTRAIAESGGESLRDSDGEVLVNRLAAPRDRAERSMLRFLAEFGLSPASRSRVIAQTTEPEVDDPGERFLRERLRVVTDG